MRRLLVRNHHMHVPHSVVRLILRQVDPVGVVARQHHRLHRRTYYSHGPNDVWHVDGYDKLRPYGILISGCIDGFSRKIIWLKAASSNHRPGLIAKYFVDSVHHVGGYPQHVRTDCGTENNVMAAIQCMVTNDASAHIYGTSPGNQRIEAWWSFFRRYRSQWWIEVFERLMEFGAFHPGCQKEVECLRFCFMDLIQKDLDEARCEWNTHRIRPTPGARCPAGVPDELYFLPQPPAVNCLLTDTDELPQEVLADLEEPQTCDSSDFQSYLDYVCSFNNWDRPTDHEAATRLFLDLIGIV